MQTPLISVIVPVYKVEQYLPQCIDSILGQTYQNLEIILVDDGSPDNCGAMCDRYAEKDPRIQVIHQTNRGLSAARNAAMDICTGDLIAFVDSDDWIEPEMYGQMVRMMLDQDLDVVFCGVAHVRDGQVLEYLGQYYEDGAVVPAAEVLSGCLKMEIQAYVWNRLSRRHCIEKLRFPEGWVYEDVPVSHLPFVYSKRPVGFLHTPLYNYRRNKESISSDIKPAYWLYRFMGKQTLYQYAKENMSGVVGTCLKNAVHAAMDVCNSEVRYPQSGISGDVRIAEGFLRENLGEILGSPRITVFRKAVVLLRLYLKPLHRMLYRILKV